MRLCPAGAALPAVGHVCGGRVFGYDNVEIVDAGGKRSHVERRINEAEAAIVRRMFELCADGAGLTRITKLLNADGCPAPRPQQARPGGWVHSTVRDVLHREQYRGVTVWNQTRKRDRWGKQDQRPRPQAEWLRVPTPALQIVSADLWTRAHAQLTTRRHQYSQIGKPVDGEASARGRMRRDTDAAHLLTGLARCATCGGGMSVLKRQHGGQMVPLYGCLSH